MFGREELQISRRTAAGVGLVGTAFQKKKK